MTRPPFLLRWRRQGVTVLLPFMTVIAIVFIVSLDLAFAMRERQLLGQIQQQDYPDLLISEDLQQLMKQLQRNFQDAVAGDEPERLADADRTAAQILGKMSFLQRNVNERSRWVRDAARFRLYFTLTRRNCERLMVGVADESMAATLVKMQFQYRALAAEIDAYAALQQREIEDAFVGARRFHTESVFATLTITILSTVMLGWLAMATTTRSLNRNLSLLESTFESTLDGILVVDREGIVQWLNHRFISLFGLEDRTSEKPPDEETLFRLAARLSSNHRLLDLLESFRRHPESGRSEVIHLWDGRTIECSLSPQWLKREAIGRVWNFRDITARTALESQVEQAQRVESLGRLAATVAHEFNNVLMGIQMSSEIIRKKSSSQAELQPTMARLVEGVERGKRVTQAILRFTQPAEPVLQQLDVNDWIAGVVEEIRLLVGPGVVVTLDVPPQRLLLSGDAAQLVQVLTNLSLNARDAMSGAGTLRIVVRPADPADPRFATLGNGEEDLLEIEVRDDGPGMPPEILSHIFEPLFTTKKSGGTGLGLAVAYQVLARHRGLILVDSVVGVGTTFHLILPLGTTAKAVEAAPRTNSGPTVRRILVVEDEPAIAAGLAILLEMEGMEVRVADRGAEAVPSIEQFDPEIVLLDVGLPDMDGIELGRRIATRWPDLPILFSTGHADEGGLDAANFPGPVGFLLKPYSAETLLAELARLASLRMALTF